jgi:hypothetical protein
MEHKNNELSRRSFVKATAYVAPVILTLRARPAHASVGSGHSHVSPGVSAKQVRSEARTFVTDLRNSEHGPISPEVHSRMRRTVESWQDSGADKYIERSVSRTINRLHRSGNDGAKNRMKTEVARLLDLAKRLLGL